MQKNNSENAEMLYQAILSLSSPEECRAFFQDLCTVAELRAIEDDIHAHIVDALSAGKPDEAMNAKGQLTAMQRVSLLVDAGTWCPLNSLYNPEHN